MEKRNDSSLALSLWNISYNTVFAAHKRVPMVVVVVATDNYYSTSRTRNNELFTVTWFFLHASLGLSWGSLSWNCRVFLLWHLVVSSENRASSCRKNITLKENNVQGWDYNVPRTFHLSLLPDILVPFLLTCMSCACFIPSFTHSALDMKRRALFPGEENKNIWTFTKS